MRVIAGSGGLADDALPIFAIGAPSNVLRRLRARVHDPTIAMAARTATPNVRLKFQLILFVFEAQLPTVAGQFPRDFDVQTVAM